jgi:hypothetical protein
MADCLNAMTVGIQHESAVIVGVIFGPQPWRTIVTPTSGERRFVKGGYRATIGSAEAEMRAGNWGFDLGFIGDRKFDTERARRSTIIGRHPPQFLIVTRNGTGFVRMRHGLSPL